MANTLNLGNGNWGVKKDSLLAYNSENGNFKPLAFNFTRASSATVVNKAGLIETVGSGEPRIDFSNDAKGALLLEPTRSNKITNSEQFVDAPIGNTNMDLFSGAITNNDTTSPNGNVTAMKFTIGGTSSSLLRIYQSDLSTSSDNTFSIYAKKGTANSLSIDITDVTVVNSILTDEWQRISVTNISTSSKFIDVEVLGNVGEYIYIFGLQLEQSSYATSYIPTQGSAVTRVAENITQTTPNLSNSQEVTAFIDLGARPLTGINSTSNNFRLDFGAGNTRIIYNQNGSSNHRIELNINGSATYYTLSNLLTTTRVKIGVSVTPTTLVIYANGVEYHSVSIAGADWSNLLAIETSITESIGNIKINDFKVYNTALTDAELIALTK
jgi:hypothetical protein